MAKVPSSLIEDTDSDFTTETAYVLVIYTGGTIGMKESPLGRCYIPHDQ